jgi:hypothetical protein
MIQKLLKKEKDCCLRSMFEKVLQIRAGGSGGHRRLDLKIGSLGGGHQGNFGNTANGQKAL